MADPDLPDLPVVAWREARSPWWVWPLAVLSYTAFEHRREVTVSANGLSITGWVTPPNPRFLAWDEVDDIVAGKGRDLARIRLVDGSDVVLDHWHLPAMDPTAAAADRLDLLRRALAASRESTS